MNYARITIFIFSIIGTSVLFLNPGAVFAMNTFPAYDQDGYWFLDDDASVANVEDETGFGAGNVAENTNITGLSKNSVFQIRLDVSETAKQDQGLSLIWTLQYKAASGGACNDSSGWTQITTSSGNAFQIVSANSITETAEADLDRITTNAKGFNSTQGALLDASNSHTSLLDTDSAETQWAIQATTNAGDSTAYIFRVSDNNSQTGINSYTRCPQATTAATPTTTLANDTDPEDSTVAPGASATDIDQFSFTTDSGSDTITALTVTLSPANSYDNLSLVEITNTSNVDQCTDITNPSSIILNFTGCSLSATTGGNTYKIRITPKTHANMPAVPGTSYDTGATVTAFTSTNTQAGSDSGSATITVDNASPSSATSHSASAGDAQITLNWTTSASADYERSVILRWAAGTPGSEVPEEGSDYSVDATISTATVACVETTGTSSFAESGIDGAGTGGCSAVALSNGQQYSYKIFQKDTNGNYDAGVTITGSPFTPVAASLTFVVTTDNFGSITPGTPVFATSTLSVDTTNATGWNVTLSGDNVNVTNQVLIDGSSNEITDKDPEWIASSATTSAGNAASVTSGDDVLAFRVMSASGTVAFFSTSWWGTSDVNFNGSQLWAGIASSTNVSKIGDSSVTSGGGAALNTVQYYLDVSSSQPTGTYTGQLTFTAVANP